MFLVPPRLLEVGRNLNKADTEGLKQCAYYFKQLDQVQLKEFFFFEQMPRACENLDLLQVELSSVLKSERSELQYMMSCSDQASDEVSSSTCFAWMDLNHIINSRGKMIDICCVRSGVKYRSLSYWSVVMTSLVEFSTGEFRAQQVWKIL